MQVEMKKGQIRTARRFLLLVVFLASLGGAFTAGTITGFSVRTASASASNEPATFSVFWEVWDLVDQYFVDQDKIDPTKMTYGAIHGMLATLGDENHTVFFSPEEAKQQADSMEGSFEGIGAYVESKDGYIHIVAPIHGSPAEESGILAGDIVFKVNGEDVAGLPEWEVISKIRGPAGTSVVLTVLHADEKKPVDITVQRGKIDVESVTWSRIPQTDFAYVKISQFADDTGIELERVLKDVNAAAKQSPIKGILLDLRNNPGGYLSEALRVNSEFLPRGEVILHERDAKGEIKTWKSVGEGLARDIPIVALINEGTASAGEITAGALQENGRAKLLGQPTLGTGTVLQPFTLSDGSVVRLGVTNWLTPKQNLIKGEGIKPDINLEQDVSVTMVDNYALEDTTLDQVLQTGDRQFNLGLLNLRLLVK
jgi:carboxyl-terminal processing protease